MTSPRINWQKREDHPLMRKPEWCPTCKGWHLKTMPCFLRKVSK